MIFDTCINYWGQQTYLERPTAESNKLWAEKIHYVTSHYVTITNQRKFWSTEIHLLFNQSIGWMGKTSLHIVN